MKDKKLFESPEQSEPIDPYNTGQVYNQLLEAPGMEMGFEVTVKNTDPDKTLSKETFEALKDNMAAWVGSRVVRKAKAGNPPKHIQVTVIVSCDGEPWTFADTLPIIGWFDGGHRSN